MNRPAEPPIARPLRLALLAAAVAALWLASLATLPLPASPVPLSLQSLAVVCVGLLLGPWHGTAAVAVYLLAGALGAPVFAGGKAGLAAIGGPTGGFLVGFLPAAWLAGHWVRSGRAASLGRAWLGMLLAHGVILACGWARLATAIGPVSAAREGVTPFLAGALLKALAAGCLAWTVFRWRARR